MRPMTSLLLGLLAFPALLLLFVLGFIGPYLATDLLRLHYIRLLDGAET